MSEFINTADVIGDDEMCDQIIMRTVTEYKENRITKVGQYAFYGCEQLEVVDLPNATSIGNYAFPNCANLTEVDVPNVTEIGEYAFQGCTNLMTVNFPKLVTIRQRGLKNCKSLSVIELPEVTTLGTEALNNCAIPWLCLPKYTSSGYDWNVFSGNTALRVVDLPVIETLGLNYGFSGCTNLAAVILRGSTVCSMTSSTVFNNDSGITKGTGYIYVPRAMVDSYKAATNWSTYAAQFRALEDYTVDGTTTGALDESKI